MERVDRRECELACKFNRGGCLHEAPTILVGVATAVKESARGELSVVARPVCLTRDLEQGGGEAAGQEKAHRS